MITFYVTFGQKSPFRDGWVEVEAIDQKEAYNIVNYAISDAWSNMYVESEMAFDLYPQGRIGRKIK